MAIEKKEGQATSLTDTKFTWDNDESFFNGGKPTPSNSRGVMGTLSTDEDEDENEDNEGIDNESNQGFQSVDEDNDEGEDFEGNDSPGSSEETQTGKKDKKPANDKQSSATKKKGEKVSSDNEEGEDDGDEGEDGEGNDNEGGEEEGDDFYTALAEEFVEKGRWQHVQIPEGKKLTEEDWFELQEQEDDARVQETLTDMAEELSNNADAIRLLNYIKAGGSSDDFFANYSAIGTHATFDPEDETQAERFMRQWYLKSGEVEPEDIDEKIQWHKDSKNLGKYAKKHYTAEKSAQDKAKEQFVKAQQDNQRKIIESNKKFTLTVKNTISSAKEVASIPLTKEDKEQLPDFMTKPTIKIDEDRYITPFQKELNEAMKDPITSIALAKILKDKFNLKGVEVKGANKKVGGIKSRLQEAKNSGKRPSSTSSSPGSLSLADMIQDFK